MSHINEQKLQKEGVILYSQLLQQNPEDSSPVATTSAKLNDTIRALENIRADTRPLHPILALPPELLKAIFEQAAILDELTPFQLTLVNVSWREIALNTPTLWNNVVVDEGIPNILDDALFRLILSKQVPIFVSVKDGRNRIIPSLEMLLGEHLNRIVTFEWSSSRYGFFDQNLHNLVGQMRNLEKLHIDYEASDIAGVLESIPALFDLSITATSNAQINQILEVIQSTKTIKSLSLLRYRPHSLQQQLKIECFPLLPLQRFKFSVDLTWNRMVDIGSWFDGISRMRYLQNLELLGAMIRLPIDLGAFPTSKSDLSVVPPLKTLIIATMAITQPVVDFIIKRFNNLTTLSLACDAESTVIKHLLTGIQEIPIRRLLWTGLKGSEDHADIETDATLVTLNSLVYLGFEPTNEAHIATFSVIFAPALKEIDLGAPNNYTGWYTASRPDVQDRFINLVKRSSNLRILKTHAIPWFSSDQIILPDLEHVSLCGHDRGFPNISGIRSKWFHLEVYLSMMTARAWTVSPSLLSSVTRLDMHATGIRYRADYIGSMDRLLQRLPNIQILRLPNEDLGTPHIDQLCNALLSHPHLCPMLEEIHSPQYSDWNLLLRFIKSRNTMRALTPEMDGPVAIRLVAFPRQLHVNIFSRIQKALRGFVVGEVPEWDLPSYLQFDRCTGCMAARIHTCRKEEHPPVPSLRPWSGYCSAHRSESLVSITADFPILP